MVLVLGGVVLDEASIDTRSLYHLAPHLKESAAHVTSLPPKVVSPIGLLYLHQREFAVTLPHDSKPRPKSLNIKKIFKIQYYIRLYYSLQYKV